MRWTKEREEKLCVLWSSGLTAPDIAVALGGFERCADKGKNAVIGKVHRLIEGARNKNDAALLKRITVDRLSAVAARGKYSPRTRGTKKAGGESDGDLPKKLAVGEGGPVSAKKKARHTHPEETPAAKKTAVHTCSERDRIRALLEEPIEPKYPTKDEVQAEAMPQIRAAASGTE